MAWWMHATGTTTYLIQSVYIIYLYIYIYNSVYIYMNLYWFAVVYITCCTDLSEIYIQCYVLYRFTTIGIHFCLLWYVLCVFRILDMSCLFLRFHMAPMLPGPTPRSDRRIGWTDRTDGRTDRTDGQTDGQPDRRTDERTDRMAGRTDGRTDRTDRTDRMDRPDRFVIIAVVQFPRSRCWNCSTWSHVSGKINKYLHIIIRVLMFDRFVQAFSSAEYPHRKVLSRKKHAPSVGNMSFQYLVDVCWFENPWQFHLVSFQMYVWALHTQGPQIW
jgi:hypothetical protein